MKCVRIVVVSQLCDAGKIVVVQCGYVMPDQFGPTLGEVGGYESLLLALGATGLQPTRMIAHINRRPAKFW